MSISYEKIREEGEIHFEVIWGGTRGTASRGLRVLQVYGKGKERASGKKAKTGHRKNKTFGNASTLIKHQREKGPWH